VPNWAGGRQYRTTPAGQILAGVATPATPAALTPMAVSTSMVPSQLFGRGCALWRSQECELGGGSPPLPPSLPSPSPPLLLSPPLPYFNGGTGFIPLTMF